MREIVIIDRYRETDTGTDLIIHVPGKRIGKKLTRKGVRSAELRIDDQRHITAEQRKKIYATVRDIADWSGYLPEEMKEWLKYLHIQRTGSDYITLSDCSMDEASAFLDTILGYALENGVQLPEPAVNRADDVSHYLYLCLKHKRCAVCGARGEVHHVDAIGMGNDRRKVDDRMHRKICLCRKHHTIAHTRGMQAFEDMYHVYGIIYEGEQNEEDKH